MARISESAASAAVKAIKASHWVADNRGLSSKLAQRLGKSPQFIGMVLRGKRRSALVEKELRALGAPVPAPPPAKPAAL